MQKYTTNVIISDVTYMKDEKYCVAGWEPTARKMRRLMPEGHHWHGDNLNKIKQYSYITVKGWFPANGRDYPHKSEDMAIDLDTLKILSTYDTSKKLANDLEGSIHRNVKSIFRGNLKENTYVPAKSKCPSLGAVVIPSFNLEFFRDNGKLRVSFKDNDDDQYDLRVTCKYLRDVLDKEKSLKGLNLAIKDYGRAHIRVGLAKPFAQQDNNCFLMCNGVFLF